MASNLRLRESARLQLRDATADVHQALHQLPAFVALLAGRLGRADYAGLLVRLHRYHDHARAICAAADRRLGIDPPGHSARARIARLDADLAALGTAPIAEPERAPGDADWNIGYAYVVRGSAIGGQTMHVALARMFGGESEGRSFFALGQAERADWRDFCRRMDGWLDGRALDAAIAGAGAAFADFQRGMAPLPRFPA